jgi:hypothetical protein
VSITLFVEYGFYGEGGLKDLQSKLRVWGVFLGLTGTHSAAAVA